MQLKEIQEWTGLVYVVLQIAVGIVRDNFPLHQYCSFRAVDVDRGAAPVIKLLTDFRVIKLLTTILVLGDKFNKLLEIVLRDLSFCIKCNSQE